jgi:hypothetical protein
MCISVRTGRPRQRFATGDRHARQQSRNGEPR